MKTTLSKDGTRIAFDRTGSGPAVILVDGALCHRRLGPSAGLAKLLAKRFTVYGYDRRGRGDSSDTAPYAVQREIDDLQAVLSEAGGSASLYGTSSGAVLALDAATRLRGVTSLVLFEAPFIVDDSRKPIDNWGDIDAAIASGDRGRAVKLFLKAVEVPAFVLAVMSLLPVWHRLKAVAHTLPYDGAIMRGYQQGRPLPRDPWAALTIPALVMDGGKSPVWMRNGNRALAELLPNSLYKTLPGQTHMVKPAAHVPVVTEFLAQQRDGVRPAERRKTLAR